MKMKIALVLALLVVGTKTFVHAELTQASTTIFFCASDCLGASDPTATPELTMNLEVDARRSQELTRVVELSSTLLPLLVKYQIAAPGSQRYIGLLSLAIAETSVSQSILTRLDDLQDSIGVMVAFSDIPYLDSIRKAAINYNTILIVIQNSRFVPSWISTSDEGENDVTSSAGLRATLGSKEIHISLRGDEIGYVLGKAVMQATKTSGKVAYLVSSAHEANGRGEGVALGEVEGYFEATVEAGMLVSIAESCRQCEVQRLTRDESSGDMLEALHSAQASLSPIGTDFDVVVASGYIANQVARTWALEAAVSGYSQQRSIITIGPSWMQDAAVFNNSDDAASQAILMNLEVKYDSQDIVDRIDLALSASCLSTLPGCTATSRQTSLEYVPVSTTLLNSEPCVYNCNHPSRVAAVEAWAEAAKELVAIRTANSMSAASNTVGFDVVKSQLSQPSYYNVNQLTTAGNLGSSLVGQGTFFPKASTKLSADFAVVSFGTEIHIFEDAPLSLSTTPRYQWVYHPLSDSLEWLHTSTSTNRTSICAGDAVLLALFGSGGQDRQRTVFLHGGSNCGLDVHGSSIFLRGVRSSSGVFEFSEVEVANAEAGPSSRRNHQGVVLNSTSLLLYGGHCNHSSSNYMCSDVWIFNTDTHLWTEHMASHSELLGTGRYNAGVALWEFSGKLNSAVGGPNVTDSRWLVISGGLERTANDQKEHYSVLALGLSAWAWVQLTPSNNEYLSPSSLPCVVPTTDRLVILGGSVGPEFTLLSSRNRLPYVHVFSPATGNWASGNDVYPVDWTVGHNTKCIVSTFTHPSNQASVGGVVAFAFKSGSLQSGAVNRLDFNPIQDNCHAFRLADEAAVLADTGGEVQAGLYYTGTSGLSCHRCSGQTYAYEERCISCASRPPELGWQKDLCAVTGTNQVYFALAATLLLQVVCYPVFFMAIRAMRLTREASEQEATITELAEAVAEQKFEKVAFLDRMEKGARSRTQDALIACVRNLKKYRSFIPPAILTTTDRAVADLQNRRDAGQLIPNGAASVEVDRRVSAIEVGANESSDEEEDTYSAEESSNDDSMASGVSRHSRYKKSKSGKKVSGSDDEISNPGLSFFATRTGEIGNTGGGPLGSGTGSQLNSHDRLLVNQEIIYSLRPRLESRQGSVIVANIVGFQLWAESQRGKLIKRYIKYTETLLGAIQQFKGIVDCVVGDKVVGSFNAAQACEKHQFMACWAAYEIAKNTQLQGIGLKAVVGCSSGDVLFGIVGSEKAKQSILLSTAVGEAASLCKQTQKQGVDILFPFRFEPVLDSGFVYKVVGVGLFEQPQPAASYDNTEDHGTDPPAVGPGSSGGVGGNVNEVPRKRELVCELVAPSNDPMWWYERRGVKEEIESFNTAMRLVFRGKVAKAAEMPLSQLPEWDVQVVETVIRDRQLPTLNVECRW